MGKLLDEHKALNKAKNKKSFTMKYAIQLLKGAIKDIQEGECSEDDVMEILAKVNPERHDYIKESDYVNYDKALKELPIGYNRNKLVALTKEYGIENKRVNNMPIGFSLKEIRLLKDKLFGTKVKQ